MTRPNGLAATTSAPTVQTREGQAELLERVVEATQAARQFSVAEIQTMAKYVGNAGFGFNEAQAFTLMMICDADGRHPIEALRRYDIHKSGKWTMKAVAMLAEMQLAGWEVRLLTDPNDGQYQEFSFHHPTKTVVCPKMAFGVNEAEAAGLMTKDNYRGYAPDMFRARAISRACRLNEPGIVAGVYTPEEVDEIDRSMPHRRFEPPPARPEPLGKPAAPSSAEHAVVPRSGDCKRWVQDAIDSIENRWKIDCVKAKIPHKPLGENGKPINVWQVFNGIISEMIEDEILPAETVQSDGKRDRDKVKDVIKTEWDTATDDFKDQVRSYLNRKLQDAAHAFGVTGINLDNKPALAGEEKGFGTVDSPA